jgi:hypothetical protein
MRSLLPSVLTGVHRALYFVCLFALMLPSAMALSQDMQLIKPSPSGRPAMVKDEGDTWAKPVILYSDTHLELLVSENLTLAGVLWDGPSFKERGTYATYIYTFYKDSHECIISRIPPGHGSDPDWLKACGELRYNRRLILVDRQKKTITIRQSVLMEGDGQPRPDLLSYPNTTIPLDDSVNPILFHALTRVTSMIEFRIKSHPEWRDSQKRLAGAVQ